MTNREIDELCTKHIMQGPKAKCGCCFSVLPYSTDPAASKQLRDRMREIGWLFSIQTNLRSFTAYCFLPSETPHDSAKFSREITHQSEEMAVALAALAALGVPHA